MPLDVRWLLPPGAPAEKVADAVQSFRVATGAKVTGASTLLMPLTGTHAGGDGDERLHQCGPLLVMPSGSGAAAMSPNPTFAQLAASLTKKTLFTVAR